MAVVFVQGGGNTYGPSMSTNSGVPGDVAVLTYVGNGATYPLSLGDFTTSGLTGVSIVTQLKVGNISICFFVGNIISTHWSFAQSLGGGTDWLGWAEFSGLSGNASNFITNSGSGNEISTGSLDVQDGVIVAAFNSTYGPLQNGYPTGYTQVYYYFNTDAFQMCYKIVNAGSYDTVWELNGGGPDWVCGSVGFKLGVNQIEIWNGSAWIPATIQYWNGAAWTENELEVNTAGWQPVYQSP